MKKSEYIEKFGIEAYQRKLEKDKAAAKARYKQNPEKCKAANRAWHEQNRERHNANTKAWKEQNNESYREKAKAANNAWFKEQRKKGWSVYCKENYEQIENYDLAKLDEFEPSKWELHHRKEEMFSAKTLKAYDMYFDVQPEELIWLPKKVHRSDAVISSYDPTKSKWHQKRLELWGKNLEDYKKRHSRKASETWKKRPEYIACEGKHQLQDHEQFKQYHLEYQREYRKTHSEYYRKLATLKRLPKQIEHLQNKLGDQVWVNKHTPDEIDRFRARLQRYIDQLEELKREKLA